VGGDFVEPNPPLEKVEPKTSKVGGDFVEPNPTNTSKVGGDFVEPNLP
jgi:hypothetical protein